MAITQVMIIDDGKRHRDQYGGLEMSTVMVKAIDAKGLAEMLGLSVRTIRRLDCSAKLPRPVHIGGAVRWNVPEIEAWLAAGCPDREKWETVKEKRVG